MCWATILTSKNVFENAVSRCASLACIPRRNKSCSYVFRSPIGKFRVLNRVCVIDNRFRCSSGYRGSFAPVSFTRRIISRFLDVDVINLGLVPKTVRRIIRPNSNNPDRRTSRIPTSIIHRNFVETSTVQLQESVSTFKSSVFACCYAGYFGTWTVLR